MDARVLEKFHANIEKTETCWNWKGFLDKKGCPIIRATGLPDHSPRRITLALAGKLPPKKAGTGISVTCGNKLCLNPDHLISDNVSRFWSRVKVLGPDDCWHWTGLKDKDGYGRLTVNKKDWRATRYLWFLTHGEEPDPSMCLCHKCDTVTCLNPSHLWLGTIADNNADKLSKERQPRGETHGSSKLTEAEVLEILNSTPQNRADIKRMAKQYSVEPQTIYAIRQRKSWKHI